MQREIKFRVYDKISKKMYRWLHINSIPLRDFDLEHYELMQYIGFTDKNKKQIYEGDIVEFYNGIVNIDKEIGIVDTTNFMAFLNTNTEAGDYLCNYDSDELEVLGNIYENTELLKNLQF